METGEKRKAFLVVAYTYFLELLEVVELQQKEKEYQLLWLRSGEREKEKCILLSHPFFPFLADCVCIKAWRPQ